MKQLLIIDNDAELCDLLSKYLKNEGFLTVCCHEAEYGIKTALSQNFSAIILDLMLPQASGFEVLKRIRASSEIPILMLTAKSNDVDRIISLEIGADDFLRKPCNPRELLARLKAIIRRNTKIIGTVNKVIAIGALSIEPNKHSAYLNNELLDLTNAEYNILQILMGSPEQAFSKEELTTHALNRKYTAFDRSIDVHISNLRSKLLNNHYTDSTIKTVRGFGYLLSQNTQESGTNE